jgi:hypothetical protein
MRPQGWRRPGIAFPPPPLTEGTLASQAHIVACLPCLFQDQGNKDSVRSLAPANLLGERLPLNPHLRPLPHLRHPAPCSCRDMTGPVRQT